MSALSAVATPPPAVLPNASPARADAAAPTTFAAVLDSLPHAAAKPRGGGMNSEGPGQDGHSKGSRGAAQDRAALESALALTPAMAGLSASPAAIGGQTDMASVVAADANAAGAVEAATASGRERASAPIGDAKIAGAKLLGDRSFHAAPAPRTAATFIEAAPPDARAAEAAAPLATARQGALDAKAVGGEPPPAQAASETDLVAQSATVPDAAKAAAGDGAPHPDDPRGAAHRQTGRSAATKSPAATAPSSKTTPVQTAGPAPYRGRMHPSQDGDLAAPHETTKSAVDAPARARAADAGQPTPAPAAAIPTAPTDAGSAAAAIATPSQTPLSGSPSASAPQGIAAPPKSVPAAAPVREIDVDLAPGEREPMSMTMRLAGDRLSVVIRAGSGHAAGALETAREAIAERLAAIGQPLASLVIRQTGANPGETLHANDPSRESRDWPQGRSREANDPRGDRRGGPPDRR